MSLLGKIAKGIGKVVKKVAPIAAVVPGPVGQIGKIATGVLSAGVASSAIKTLPALSRTLPGVGKAVLRSPTARGIGGGIAGTLLVDAAGNLIQQKRRRRINPLNARALNRALKRVEAAKKTCSRVNRITVRKEKCHA